jgi:hypothetical protein
MLFLETAGQRLLYLHSLRILINNARRIGGTASQRCLATWEYFSYSD